MITVRCISCQRLFSTDAKSPSTRVQCPSCGKAHRLSSLPTSTAGDSMMLTPVELKQILESPKAQDVARSYDRAEPVILCPACKVRLYVDRKKYGGRRVNCPQCKNPLVVPRLSKELHKEEN